LQIESLMTVLGGAWLAPACFKPHFMVKCSRLSLAEKIEHKVDVNEDDFVSDIQSSPRL